MDNIMNRPLFRRREARDRLNDMAGVQGYQVGGPVFAPSGAIMRPMPQGFPTAPQQGVRPAGLPSIADQAAAPLSNMSAMDIAPLTRTDTMTLGLNAPGLERATSEDLPRLTRFRETIVAKIGDAVRSGDAQAIGLLRDQLSVIDQTIARAGQNPGPITDRGVFDVEGPEPVVSQMSPEQINIFNSLDRAAQVAVPAPADQAERPAPGLRPRTPELGQPAPDAMPAVPGAAPVTGARTTDQGPAFERTGRGAAPLIENPAQVAAGLNAPDPAVREKTAADFMQEFMANAPKYEGGDKKLMHAMIGFAIASGDSPNAMTNIAQGLQAGAQMFLQDKAAKDEFDRQIQLSAVQYGLGEAARERELGRQFTNYVANKGVTYRGRTYGPGESVPVLHSDIVNGRMPEGVITEGTSDALLATDAAIRKSMAEAAQNRVLSGAEYRSAIETLDNAASEYTSARNLMPLLEASLVRAANGEVTGISSALTRKMNEAMNAFGLKPPSEYESPEAFESALRQVSVSMVQDLLGESGKTISDADRRLIDGLIGLQQDIVSGVIKDPDILTRKVQELMRVLESKQRSALDTYTTAMEGYGGSFTPSGTPVRSYRAERVFNSEEASPQVRYQFDDQGRLVIVREGQ